MFVCACSMGWIGDRMNRARAGDRGCWHVHAGDATLSVLTRRVDACGQVSNEVKELFQYIGRYKPQTIELETKLKPFIPDYIPAIGAHARHTHARTNTHTQHHAPSDWWLFQARLIRS